MWMNSWIYIIYFITTPSSVTWVDLSSQAFNSMWFDGQSIFTGKVQRMLVYHGKFPPRKAVETLVEAIKTSFNNDHDLGSGLFLIYFYNSFFKVSAFVIFWL